MLARCWLNAASSLVNGYSPGQGFASASAEVTRPGGPKSTFQSEDLCMGDRGKGKDKGKLKKKPKAVKPGVRPHEQPRPVSDVLKRDS